MRHTSGITVVLAVALAFSAAAFGESASVLLEKGIFKEDTAGDLDAAMKIYKQIVEDDKANRKYVAEAQYRMGMCLIKQKKNTEAVAAFEKLIADFPDQKKFVTQARKRIVESRKKIAGLELAKIVKEAVTTISTCTEHDPRVKKSLASLEGLNEQDTVKAVAGFLDSEKDTVRRSAIFILWKGDFTDITPAVPGLIKVCKHKEGLTRGMAAIALGGGKIDSAFKILCDMTLKDKSPYARRCAAYALGLTGRADAKPILEKALKDENELVRHNAKYALAKLSKVKTASRFGPVIERVINDIDETNANQLLDFETGKLFTLPDGFGKWKGRKRAEWMVKQGIDALVDHASNRWALGGYDFVAASMGSVSWEAIHPADVRETLATGEPGAKTITRGRARSYFVGRGTILAFKTREGGMGVLQIVGFNNKPRSVKIRYKMLKRAPVFLPLNKVVERTVYDDSSGKEFLIDIDTGKVFGPHAVERIAKGTEFAFCAKTGIDAGAETSRRGPGLWGIDMIVIPRATEPLEKITLGGITDEIATGKPGTPAVMSALGELPRTYAFKTREGSMGVLQILQVVSKKPAHIKIRYKLLKHGRPVQDWQRMSPAKARKVRMLVETSRSLMAGVFKAVENSRADLALDLNRKLVATGKQLLDEVGGTEVEQGIEAVFNLLVKLQKALEKKDLEGAKALLKSLNKIGPGLDNALNAAIAKAPPAPARIRDMRNVRRTVTTFLNTLAAGKIDSAYEMTTPQYRKDHKKLAKLPELFNIDKVEPVEIRVAVEAACVVTSRFPPKEGKRETAIGIGLIRYGRGWLIRDIDWLPTDEAKGKFVSGFKRAYPDAIGGTVREVTTLTEAGKRVILHKGDIVDLDTGATSNIHRESGWPRAFDLSWNTYLGGVFAICPQGFEKCIPLKEASTMDQAVALAQQRTAQLAGGGKSERFDPRSAGYFAVVTDRLRVAVVHVEQFDAKGTVTISWRIAPVLTDAMASPEAVRANERLARTFKRAVEAAAHGDRRGAAKLIMASLIKGHAEPFVTIGVCAPEVSKPAVIRSMMLLEGVIQLWMRNEAGGELVLEGVISELAAICEGLNRYDEAAKYYQVCLQLNPKSTDAKAALERTQQAAEAVSVAGKWLGLVDKGKYDESWDDAAESFKAAVTKQKWAASIRAVRAPLGKVKSRKLLSARYTTSLPGTTDGEYVVIQYQTSFENKKNAVETVTLMKCMDSGKWRVSGYYIK